MVRLFIVFFFYIFNSIVACENGAESTLLKKRKTPGLEMQNFEIASSVDETESPNICSEHRKLSQNTNALFQDIVCGNRSSKPFGIRLQDLEKNFDDVQNSGKPLNRTDTKLIKQIIDNIKVCLHVALLDQAIAHGDKKDIQNALNILAKAK